jgi:diacylglycerol O-acyltransferase / wax synthase
VLAQAARQQARQRFFNMVVTNIPGPQMPLYVLGRELLDLIPMAPLARRQALCIAVMSYNGKLDFGLLADFDALPDIAAVGRGIEHSLDELRSAAGVEPPEAKVDQIPAADRAAAAQPNGGRPEPSAIGE